MTRRTIQWGRLLLAAGALVLAGCGPAPEPAAGPAYEDAPTAAQPLYRLAVHPLHNPKKLTESYTPLVAYLNRHLPGARFELEASRDYPTYEQKLLAREPEFLLPNPWQTLQAIKRGYRVIAVAGDAEDFRGIFLVRRDSPVRVPADLKGKAVSYPSPTALAAAIMPQWYLHENGVDVMRDIENRYVGSQESSIMNAYLGEVAAAATWLPPWRLFQQEHPREAAQLKVIWQTPRLQSNSVMARGDVPAALVDEVRRLLLSLHETAEGRAVLAGIQMRRFHAGDDASYDAVRDFVGRFEREVRPVGAQ